MILFLTELDKNGTLKKLIRFGVIPLKFLQHYEIYLEVDMQWKTSQKNKSAIVTDVTEKFRVSEGQVYTILREFKKRENENRGTDTDSGR